jgi:hypothetical protein
MRLSPQVSVHVFRLQLVAPRRLSLQEPCIESLFLSLQIRVCPSHLVVEDRLDPITLLMKFPDNGRRLFGEDRWLNIESGVMPNQALLEHIDSAITKRGDSLIKLQEFARRCGHVNELGGVVFSRDEFGKWHNSYASVPSIAGDLLMAVDRCDSNSPMELGSRTHRARVSYHLNDLGFDAESGQYDVFEHIALKDHAATRDFAAFVVEIFWANRFHVAIYSLRTRMDR